MSDLKDDLLAIDGVGETTAEKILTVVEAHQETENLEEAIAYLEAGNTEYAKKYIIRTLEGEQWS
jgi:endonuclease III-like uncharacterized protein